MPSQSSSANGFLPLNTTRRWRHHHALTPEKALRASALIFAPLERFLLNSIPL